MTLSDLLPTILLDKDYNIDPYEILPPNQLFHGFVEVEVEYKWALFKRLPQHPDFLDAFQKFYSSRNNNDEKFTEREVQPSEWRRTSNRDEGISFGLDTNKTYFYFIYHKEDVESKKTIDEFIQMLIKR